MEFHTGQVERSNAPVRGVSYGDDSQLIVEFYNEPVLQTAESERLGRQIYKDLPFIHIMFPGDRTKERRTKATPEHQARVPRQWEAFQKQESQAPTGTAIEQWAPISRGEAKTLKANNVPTVEILAGLSDQACDGVGLLGIRKLREQAKAWLAQANDGAEVSRLSALVQSQAADIEMLKQQIADLGAPKGGRRRAAEDA